MARDFKHGEQIVCIHDDFKLYKQGDKPAKGPKKGDVVTFMGYIQNKSFLILEEHQLSDEGDPIAWNSNKFAPLEDDKELLREAMIAIQELTDEIPVI